uniref:hypothetical protein n=1 Tax=Rhodococcus sp. AJR001 TaxID=1852041 RepID=UPI000A858F1A
MQALGWFIPAERRFYFVEEIELSRAVARLTLVVTSRHFIAAWQTPESLCGDNPYPKNAPRNWCQGTVG